MVRQIDPERLLDAAKDIEDLDLRGVNINYLLKSGWGSLDSRSLRAMEDLISPERFARILSAYPDSDSPIHGDPIALVGSRLMELVTAAAVDDSE
jgi:hypothetical protein